MYAYVVIATIFVTKDVYSSNVFGAFDETTWMPKPQDEKDFVFACLLGAYIQFLRLQEGQQQFQRGNARVQQALKKADKKSKIHCGFMNGYRKTHACRPSVM